LSTRKTAGAETADDLARLLAQAKRASKKREESNYVDLEA
jgi:hypothetical protein